MKPKVESLPLLSDESFLLVRWNELDVTELTAVSSDGKTRPFKGSGDVWHCHPGMEIVFVTKGTGTRFIGDSIAKFHAPDLIFLGSSVPHFWLAKPIAGYALQFDFGPEHAFWKLAETKTLAALWKNSQRGIQFTGELAHDIGQLIQSMPAEGGVKRLATLLAIFERFRTAGQETWRFLSHKRFPPLQESSSHRGIQKAIQLLLDSFHENLTFEEVVKASAMSKATFERQFKSHTGKTFTRFLTEVRIDYARRQLIESEQSIGEVAFASGFNNLSHFNHQFALIHGEPPSAFRKRAKASA